jgi:hypothetical protein
VLDLARTGLTTAEITRRTGVPRTTVRGWLQRGPIPQACAGCGAFHDFAALSDRYVYLLGLYLGDGCLSTHPRGVFRLRVFLDARYPAIVKECSAAMKDVSPTNSVAVHRKRSGFNPDGPATTAVVSSYSRRWPCLLPQHGPGRKHEREIRLLAWQRTLVERWPAALVRGLIQSDGCRFLNTGRGGGAARYAFSNRSQDILAIYRDACDLLGLRWTVAPHTVYVSRKSDVASLDRLVGPKR